MMAFALAQSPAGPDPLPAATGAEPGCHPHRGDARCTHPGGGGNPDIWPHLLSSDGVLDWSPDGPKAQKTIDGWWELSTSVAATARLTDLTFTWPQLTLGTRQSAGFECWVVRNAELVAGRTTNPDFVYETNEVTFSTPEIPLITSKQNLPVVPATQPLEVMLDQILVPLGPQNIQLSPVLNFRVDYSFAVSAPTDGGPALLADTPILVVDDLDMIGGVASPGAAAVDLARGDQTMAPGLSRSAVARISDDQPDAVRYSNGSATAVGADQSAAHRRLRRAARLVGIIAIRKR